MDHIDATEGADLQSRVKRTQQQETVGSILEMKMEELKEIGPSGPPRSAHCAVGRYGIPVGPP